MTMTTEDLKRVSFSKKDWENTMVKQYGERIDSGDPEFDVLVAVADLSWPLATSYLYEADRHLIQDNLEKIQNVINEYFSR